MFADFTEEDPPEKCDEAMPHIMAFIEGRDLYPIKKLDKERRESHDRQYQKYISRDGQKTGAGASKRYREEIYNKNSACDAQFINNLHHYKTCDRGSGYRGEQNHYAMDFIAENPCGPSDRSTLRNLEISSKNREINEWLSREDNPRPRTMRRSVSCCDFSLEESEPAEDEQRRKEIAQKRRHELNFKSTITNIDPIFLPENSYGVDTSKLLAEISLAMKFMIRRVNTQRIPLGDVKISKVLFSTEDHYAYVLLEDFNQQKELRFFSEKFERWHNSLRPEAKCEFEASSPKKKCEYVNVVLFLEEFIESKTAFRRARHICQIHTSNAFQRLDLYFEIDTGMLRLVEYTSQTVRCMPQMWARFPSGIVEVRFRDANSAKKVAECIKSIRRTGVARAISIDTVVRREERFYPNRWNTMETLVLQTYSPPFQPTLSSQFCQDKDCMGMCQTDEWFQKPTPIEKYPPPLHKLIKLRQRFAQAPDQNQNRVDISAYIIPYTDSHQSETVPEHYARLKFLSDFTGNFGTALVTYDKAVLWTDNPHFRIAQKELDENLWTVRNKSEHQTETMVQFLRKELAEGTLVGFDPMLVTYSFFLETSNQLASAGIRLVPIASNLIDEFWSNRPYREGNVVKIQSILECGKSPERKLRQLRDELKPRRCNATVVTELDDVMWLLNLRGNDLQYTPVTYSYLFVTLNEAHLFIDVEKIDRDARAHLTRFDVQVHPYRKVHAFISEWFEKQKKAQQQSCVYLTLDTNQWIGAIFPETFLIIDKSLVKGIRARRDVMEIDGMRESNLRDSVAMVEFLYWVERELSVNRQIYSEVEMADKLETIKRRQPSYEGLGRRTMFSSGVHASKTVHRPDHAHIVSHLQQYLVQAGGHYKNGSSCVTRTVWNTFPTPEFASIYTMVLKGHIQVASAKFPSTVTYGSRLDVFAKKTLWMQGYDSIEDTGHGVGHCFNIRDTQGDALPENDGIVEEGQVISLEPSYYEPGKFGIQIGNCYETVSEKDMFLTFKPLTLVPIQTSIIVKTTLTPEELLWINRYHYRVFTEVGAVLSKEGKMAELEWLQKACEPI